MKEIVLEAGGLRGSSAPALQTFLRRHAGIHHAEASPMSDTVTVGYDEAVISETEIRHLIEECGLHCRGEVLPRHICAAEMGAVDEHAGHVMHAEHTAHALPATPAAHAMPAEHKDHAMPAEGESVSAEVAHMGHAMGHGAGMSMEEMVRDMRNRFVLTFVLAIPVFLYSPLATDVFGLNLPSPFGLPLDILLFILSTPAVLWGGQMFFVGAYRALRNRILDMSVLVALSVGAGYLFSVAATFLFEGEVFYEASVVLLAFVLFGHWRKCAPAPGHQTRSAPCWTWLRRKQR